MLLDTPVCDFGWRAPPFSLKTPAGETFALGDVMGQNGLLLAFICNHCPYVQAVIGRLAEDAKILQSEGVGAAAIMPNDYKNYPDDSPANMEKFAAQHKMNFPYLVDETQEVAKAYNAVCTPDFFGFNGGGELQYRGRLDDAKMADASSRNAELLDAMRQIAKTGNGPEKQAPSMGCSIKWRR